MHSRDVKVLSLIKTHGCPIRAGPVRHRRKCMKLSQIPVYDIFEPGLNTQPDQSLPILRAVADAAFDQALEADLMARVAQSGVEEAYRQRGRLAARVLLIATVETPTRQIHDGESTHFLSHVDEGARQRSARLVEVFSQLSQVRVRDSSIPWRRGARLNIVTTTPTSYRYMHGKLRPNRHTTPQFLDMFEEGYLEEAERWQLSVENSREGQGIIRAAPKKIRGVRVGKVVDTGQEAADVNATPEEHGTDTAEVVKQQPEPNQPFEPPIGSTEFLTEHGVLLYLTEHDGLGYTLPSTLSSLKENIRARNLRVPREADLPRILGKLLSNVVDKAGVEF